MIAAYVIGTAQDGGMPQFGSRVRGGARRLATSVCIIDGQGRALLLDASPDIKEQERRLLDVPVYAGRAGREPFDAIALTHAHMGHYTGLVHFGMEAHNAERVPCVVTERMAGFLIGNAPWSQLIARGNLELRVVPYRERYEVWPGLTLELIPVPHRDELSDTVAISVNGNLLYLPDIDGWAQWEAAGTVIGNHDVALVDATFHDDDELPGEAVTRIGHPTVVDTIARFADLKTRIVLTHLNHTNPIANPDSSEAARVRDAGFEIAAEMMRITLG